MHIVITIYIYKHKCTRSILPCPPKGHNDRVGAVVWHPGAESVQSPSSLNVASCAADGVVQFYSLERWRP